MTSMTTINECRPEVQRFAVLMEQVLQKNDRKGGWKKMDDTDILRRIHQEILELDQEILRSSTKVDREAAIKEAVDVANFCMFLADIYGGLEE